MSITLFINWNRLFKLHILLHHFICVHKALLNITSNVLEPSLNATQESSEKLNCALLYPLFCSHFHFISSVLSNHCSWRLCFTEPNNQTLEGLLLSYSRSISRQCDRWGLISPICWLPDCCMWFCTTMLNTTRFQILSGLFLLIASLRFVNTSIHYLLLTVRPSSWNEKGGSTFLILKKKSMTFCARCGL